MAVAGRMIAKAPVTWPRDQSVTPPSHMSLGNNVYSSTSKQNPLVFALVASLLLNRPFAFKVVPFETYWPLLRYNFYFDNKLSFPVFITLFQVVLLLG